MAGLEQVVRQQAAKSGRSDAQIALLLAAVRCLNYYAEMRGWRLTSSLLLDGWRSDLGKSKWQVYACRRQGRQTPVLARLAKLFGRLGNVSGRRTLGAIRQ